MTAGQFGIVDPTLLLNGVYEVRLTATDNAGRDGAHVDERRGPRQPEGRALHGVVRGPRGAGRRPADPRDAHLRQPRQAAGRLRLRLAARPQQRPGHEAATLGLAWYGSTSPSAFPSYCLLPTRSAVVTVTLPGGQVFEFDPTLVGPCQSFVPPDEVEVSFGRPGTLASLTVAGRQRRPSSARPGRRARASRRLLLNTANFDYLNPTLYRSRCPTARSFVVRQDEGSQEPDRPRRQRLDGHGERHPVPEPRRSGLDARASSSSATPRAGSSRSRTRMDNRLDYAYDANGDLVTFTDREAHATTLHLPPGLPAPPRVDRGPARADADPERVLRRRTAQEPHGRVRQDDRVPARRARAGRRS